MFPLTVPHVTVIANGVQPHSSAECHESGCIVCWRIWCGLGVTNDRVLDVRLNTGAGVLKGPAIVTC